MRPYLLPMTDEALKHTLRNLISVIDHRVSAQEISEFCDGGGDIDSLIWRHARNNKADIRNKAATLPMDDDCRSTIATISDWQSYWRNKDGQARGATWEVTNIGSLVTPTPKSNRRSISRLLFTDGR